MRPRSLRERERKISQVVSNISKLDWFVSSQSQRERERAREINGYYTFHSTVSIPSSTVLHLPPSCHKNQLRDGVGQHDHSISRCLYICICIYYIIPSTVSRTRRAVYGVASDWRLQYNIGTEKAEKGREKREPIGCRCVIKRTAKCIPSWPSFQCCRCHRRISCQKKGISRRQWGRIRRRYSNKIDKDSFLLERQYPGRKKNINRKGREKHKTAV